MTPRLRTYQHQNGRFYLEVVFSRQKRRQYSLKTADPNEIPARIKAFQRDILPDLIRDIAPAEIMRPGDPLLRDLLDWYARTHLPSRCKPRTIHKYRQVLAGLVQYLSGHRIGRASQVSLRILEEWLQWRDEHLPGRTNGKHAGKSRSDALTIVRAFLNAAARAGELDTSPIRYWDIPKTKKRRQRALREHELDECLALIDERSPSIANLCRFLAASGWRVGDALDFRWKEVVWRDGRIGQEIDRRQIKTSDNLNYPITPPLRDCLQHELDRQGKPKPNAHVFRNASGDPWDYNAVYRRLTRCLESAGFPQTVTPHSFRTTFATLRARAGVNPKVLQNLLGHANVLTTLTHYTEVSLDDLALGNMAVVQSPRVSPKPPKSARKCAKTP